MSAKPAYFEPIRERSAKRCEQLDSDPELAAPWHQLFKQVQSPSKRPARCSMNFGSVASWRCILQHTDW